MKFPPEIYFQTIKSKFTRSESPARYNGEIGQRGEYVYNKPLISVDYPLGIYEEKYLAPRRSRGA